MNCRVLSFTFVRNRCSRVDVRNCRVREDFAVRVAFPPVLTRTHNIFPSHGIIFLFFYDMRVQYLTILMIILDKLKNGWDDEISSFCPQVETKCTVYE